MVNHMMTNGELRDGSRHFPLTAREASRVIHVDMTGSTQDDLAALYVEGEAPAWTAMIADDQCAGRGRMGRSWHSKVGQSLLISVIVELPSALREAAQWITLTGALSALEAIRSTQSAPQRLALSWPNDIVVETAGGPRKIAGLLGEVCGITDEGIACVLGWGMNLDMPASELPTPTSASLTSAGLEPTTRDALAATYLAGLRRRIDCLVSAGSAEAAGLVDEANAVTETLRPNVTVGRPRLAPVTGEGLRVLPDASLEMGTDDGIVVVTSGEVSLLGMSPGAKGDRQ